MIAALYVLAVILYLGGFVFIFVRGADGWGRGVPGVFICWAGVAVYLWAGYLADSAPL